MSALWTAKEAAAATGGEARGDWSANGISIDTRTLQPGDLFVALKGDSRDGHDFVAAALERKAGAALVSHVPPGVSREAPLLIVRDTQAGIEALGRASRARTHAKIIAVTGSAGKTTTKEMLRVILAKQGSVSASAASYNNHWGVPLSLTRMPRETAFGVFEIGMNHEGEIRALVAQVRPQAAIITTIAPAHLEYFGTLEKIADAKAEIFEGLEPGAPAILPADNPQFERLNMRAKAAGVTNILRFGTRGGSDARLLSAVADGAGQIVTAEIGGTKVEFGIGAAGGHIASNAMAALLAARAVGVPVREAADALKDFTALKGRGARQSVGDVELIDESYNANPASMSAALRLLGESKPAGSGRRIAVLGDMLELGGQGEALHRAIEKDIAASGADLVFACGAQMQALWQALPPARRGGYAATSAELAPQFLSALRPGDVVLVKGSFGSRMSVIIDALKAREAALPA
jgi:UDP-N-acetylmuramoyl-tripeptide--D-alanyl-D-alanine ligase